MDDMTPTLALNPQDLDGLEAGQQIYITTWVASTVLFSDTPVMVVGREGDDFLVVYIGEHGQGAQARLSIPRYGSDWTACVIDGFVIKTPMGVLHASPYVDTEYPGIEIELMDNQPYTMTPRRRLALVEYSPAGEGLCGFDPKNPALSRKEIDEVPAERILKKDGTPVESKDGIYPHNAGDFEISAGLVTRVWPNELLDEDFHHRVFHTEGEGK